MTMSSLVDQACVWAGLAKHVHGLEKLRLPEIDFLQRIDEDPPILVNSGRVLIPRFMRNPGDNNDKVPLRDALYCMRSAMPSNGGVQFDPFRCRAFSNVYQSQHLVNARANGPSVHHLEMTGLSEEHKAGLGDCDILSGCELVSLRETPGVLGLAAKHRELDRRIDREYTSVLSFARPLTLIETVCVLIGNPEFRQQLSEDVLLEVVGSWFVRDRLWQEPDMNSTFVTILRTDDGICMFHVGPSVTDYRSVTLFCAGAYAPEPDDYGAALLGHGKR